MTTARKQLIDLSVTPYYHCINRCVRRAFLCGEDKLTGKNYEGRKQQIIDRMKSLTESFGIELCAYAVMSNHYHVVLHVNAERIDKLSEKQVATRWTCVYPNPIGIRYAQGGHLDKNELNAIDTYLPIWRERLKDISWYMRALNENIARIANRQDDCKGHFWEGRFKSQALTDEAALLACMAYVDLNPIRAKQAQSLEEADHTSIQEHLIAHRQATQQPLGAKLKAVLKKQSQTQTQTQTKNKNQGKDQTHTPKSLKPFAKAGQSNQHSLPIERESYLQLVEYTGQAIRSNQQGHKQGHIPPQLSSLLSQRHINPNHWLSTVSNYQHAFGKVVGTITSLDQWREKQSQHQSAPIQWLKGNKSARLYYQ